MTGRRRNWRGLWPACVLPACVWMAGCEISVKEPEGTVTLVGRVFSVDEGKPVAGVEISASDGSTVKTAADGTFALRHDVTKSGPVETKSGQHAPVSKDAPKGDGYIELFV